MYYNYIWFCNLIKEVADLFLIFVIFGYDSNFGSVTISRGRRQRHTVNWSLECTVVSIAIILSSCQRSQETSLNSKWVFINIVPYFPRPSVKFTLGNIFFIAFSFGTVPHAPIPRVRSMCKKLALTKKSSRYIVYSKVSCGKDFASWRTTLEVWQSFSFLNLVSTFLSKKVCLVDTGV